MRNVRNRYPNVLTQVNLPIVSPPLSRVAVARIYVRERDREVNQEQIKVVETPVLELFLRYCFGLHLTTPLVWCDFGSRGKLHMIMGMEGVPELRVNLFQT